MNALHDFPGGLRLPANKRQSTALPIQQAPLAQRYVVPLAQHMGAPARPCVEVGQAVLKGETIALADGSLSAALHAPTSGRVVAIGEQPYPHASGLPAPAIVIDSDGEDRWTELQPCPDFRLESPPALLERIRAAGIGGLGGAGFPTAAKLAARPAERIHTLVVNGAECEPYISADDLLMRERATRVLGGIDILARILEPEEVLIGVEDDKPEAIAALGAALGERPYRIVVLPSRYPSGGERQLIQLLTGQEVPAGGLPADIGILCQNVGTLAAVHDAVVLGRPLISRIVTLTGKALARPMNVEALIGTPVNELLAFAGLAAERLQRVLMGGPMMGFALPDLSVPLVKTCNCLLAGDASELPPSPPAMPCIRCGDCAQVCPASLLPQQLHFFALGGEHEQLLAHHLFDCIECGACAYVCPSDIPLVQYYRASKAQIREQRQKLRKAEQSRERFEQRQARLTRDEERRAADRAERAEKAARVRAAQAEREAATPVAAADPVQAAIERARARKQAGSGSERLKRLKIEASMARVALKKAEKQLLSHDTPEQHGLVAELRAAAEAADRALADAQASPPRDEPAAPAATFDDEAALKQAKVQAAMARAQLKRSEKAFGDTPSAEQQAILATLRAEVERCEDALARLERSSPRPTEPRDDGQAALKRAKIALVGKRAALQKAEQAGVMDSELERLRGELQAAERDLHAAEDACGRPAPDLVRIDKRAVDPRTRELKTELAYARAGLKKLERLANADPAVLDAARARLGAAERALAEHGTERP
ncbi:electron transport complex subunit RsxC [Pseudomonas paraeruginosa]|uniref:electron transport complex subunit RsxC n=1 Tax=Pseudomonas paraeruginosa TaxID=2994495 RepID=UPI0039FB97C8